MKKLLSSALVFSTLFAISSVVSAQSIPPTPPIVPGGTNYDKCLNIATLKRETGSQKAYQTFNVAIQPQTDILSQATLEAYKFHGWLGWLNWFVRPSKEAMDRVTKADQDLQVVVSQYSPARDSALQALNSQYSTDQQYCMSHQNQTYEWTTEQQNQLVQLRPRKTVNVNKSPESPVSNQQQAPGNSYPNSNPPPMPQPDTNTIPLTILSPKTGDIWAQGYKQTVSWSSKPIQQSNTISYSLEDGPTTGEFLSYETNGLGATYSHTVGVPVMMQGKSVQPGSYRLKVTVYGRTTNSPSWPWGTVLAQGTSDYFKIVPESQSTVRYVSVSISGHGSVLSAGGISPSINCPDPFTNSSPRGCSVAYPLNQTVTLTALPTPGYKFDGWSGDCSGNLNCTVTVNAEKNVQAMFSSGQSDYQPAI